MKRNDNRSKFGQREHRRVLTALAVGRGVNDGKGVLHDVDFLTIDADDEVTTRRGEFWAWAPGGGAWLVVDGKYVEVIKLGKRSFVCRRYIDPREPGTWVQAGLEDAV